MCCRKNTFAGGDGAVERRRWLTPPQFYGLAQVFTDCTPAGAADPVEIAPGRGRLYILCPDVPVARNSRLYIRGCYSIEDRSAPNPTPDEGTKPCNMRPLRAAARYLSITPSPDIPIYPTQLIAVFPHHLTCDKTIPD